MIIFKSKKKKFKGDLKIKLCRERLYPAESVKYLGVSKLIQTLVGDIMLMISLSNSIELMLLSSKSEHMLVLKY